MVLVRELITLGLLFSAEAFSQPRPYSSRGEQRGVEIGKTSQSRNVTPNTALSMVVETTSGDVPAAVSSSQEGECSSTTLTSVEGSPESIKRDRAFHNHRSVQPQPQFSMSVISSDVVAGTQIASASRRTVQSPTAPLHPTRFERL